MTLLEDAVREALNRTAPRALCVMRPLKVILENYPEGQIENFTVPWHANGALTRDMPFPGRFILNKVILWKISPRLSD